MTYPVCDHQSLVASGQPRGEEQSVESVESVKSVTDLFFRSLEKSQEQSGLRILPIQRI